MRKGKLVYKKAFEFSEFSGLTHEKTLSKIVPVIQSFNPKGIQTEEIFVDHQFIRNPNFNTLFGRNVKLSVRVYRNIDNITLVVRLYPATPNGKLLLVNWNDSTYTEIQFFKHILKFKI